MWMRNSPVIDPFDAVSGSSSGLSEYGKEVDDLEVAMCNIVEVAHPVREVKETRFSFVEYYDR